MPVHAHTRTPLTQPHPPISTLKNPLNCISTRNTLGLYDKNVGVGSFMHVESILAASSSLTDPHSIHCIHVRVGHSWVSADRAPVVEDVDSVADFEESILIAWAGRA